MRFTMTAAEWDAADDRRKAFIAGATGFNLGRPVLSEGGTVYVVDHPKFRLEDAVRATEAFNVPDVDLPALGPDGEFANLPDGADISTELRKRRQQRGATPLPRVRP
jgi:hypothetical protein